MKTWKSYSGIIHIFCSSIVVFILPLILPGISLSQPRLDTPKANLEVADPVPVPLIKQIACERGGLARRRLCSPRGCERQLG